VTALIRRGIGANEFRAAVGIVEPHAVSHAFQCIPRKQRESTVTGLPFAVAQDEIRTTATTARDKRAAGGRH